MGSMLKRCGRAAGLGVLAVLGVLALSLNARAEGGDGPEAGGYVGAGFPVGDYNDTAEIGGVVGGWGGYRWMFDKAAVSLIGNPQFTILPSEDCPAGPLFVSCDGGSDITSTFSLTAGPKFAIVDEGTELSIAVLGGYFRDIAGPLDESGGGLAVHGALGFDVAPMLNLGVFLRFEEIFLRPAANSDKDDRQMVMAGLQLGWHPEEPVAQAPPPPPPPAPAPVTKKKIVLRGVNFDFDKATLQPQGKPILDEAARILKENPSVNVQVQGYTDSIGTDAYNLRLSDRRAATVQSYLVGQGVSANRITMKGFGESNPVASNDTADGRAQNRRVELVPTN
jgi:outer membrane protein OmpA-like peptidoglycan-associated protein